jgi:surfactin synthase thioesterase subunit
MYGLARDLADSPGFRGAFERMFRADLRLSEVYRHQPGGGRLGCGITGLAAAGDRMLPAGAMAGWAELGAGWRFVVAEGGHSFLLEPAGQVGPPPQHCCRSQMECMKS